MLMFILALVAIAACGRNEAVSPVDTSRPAGYTVPSVEPSPSGLTETSIPTFEPEANQTPWLEPTSLPIATPVRATTIPAYSPTLPHTATPTPTFEPITKPTPTPAVPPVQFMLQLINEAREDAGVAAVHLGSNRAAQIHAENALAGCYGGHWSEDGLKFYMRYSLAGGYQENKENVSGQMYCSTEPISPNIWEALIESMDGLMRSPGHRRTILDPKFKGVNLGIDWDDNLNRVVVQHFEGNYTEYDVLPTIEDGKLSVAGRALGRAGFKSENDLIVVLHWDPPPRMLTRGQIARVYTHDYGEPIVGIAPPMDGGIYAPRAYKYTTQPHPYDVQADAPTPQFKEEATELYQEAKQVSKAQETFYTHLPMMGASEWKVSEHEFEMVADVGDLLEEHGAGVYTVHVWAVLDGEPLVISKYSIWHGVEKPVGYE